MRRRHFAPTKPEAEQRLNEAITVPEVRLISHLGEQVGVVSARQALSMAQEVGLDLVEVSPGQNPPVCKLMDAGKQVSSQKRVSQSSVSAKRALRSKKSSCVPRPTSTTL